MTETARHRNTAHAGFIAENIHTVASGGSGMWWQYNGEYENKHFYDDILLVW